MTGLQKYDAGVISAMAVKGGLHRRDFDFTRTGKKSVMSNDMNSG
jgi:hypothetical protein